MINSKSFFLNQGFATNEICKFLIYNTKYLIVKIYVKVLLLENNVYNEVINYTANAFVFSTRIVVSHFSFGGPLSSVITSSLIDLVRNVHSR